MLQKLSNIKPQSFFLSLALCLFVCYSIVVPPFQTPDEYNHFYRTYRVAQGDFIPQQNNQRLGGMVPVSFQDFLAPFNAANGEAKSKMVFQDFTRSFTVACEQEYLEFKDFPNTSYYSPVSYLPQALAVFICQKLDASVGAMFYSARLAVFLFWLIFIFYAIKTTPVGKWVFVLLNLLPMQLYIANSLSADTVTNALAFALLALVLKQMLAGKKPEIKTIILMILLACGLGLAKMLYVFLVLLVLLIPATNFKNRRQWLLFVAGISLPAIMVAYWWSSVVMQNYLSFASYNPESRMHATLVEGADYYLQKDYLLKHPLKFVSVLYYSLTHHPGFYLSSYVGYFGTFMDTPLPLWAWVMAYCGMILTALTDRNGLSVNASQKWVLILTVSVVFVFLIFSQYLTWIRVGGSGVEDLQGRYLIPLMPMILLLFNRSSLQHKWNLPVLVLPIVLTLNMVSIKNLYNRYINEDSLTKTVIFYDFEKQLDDELPLMKEKISSETALSGRQSLKLINDSQNILLYKSDKIKQGDWVWLEAMCKGSGGRLNISGIKNNTEVFNYNVEYPRFVNSKGWGKLKFAQVIQNNTDSVEVSFKLLNIGETAVYFDDVRLEHKTY